MCRICESAATVAAAARGVTDAVEQTMPTGKTGNRKGLRHARQFPVDPIIPDDFQQQLDRIQQPRLG